MIRSFYGSENRQLDSGTAFRRFRPFFNWALDGLDRLRSRGYFQPPESSRVAVDQMQDLSSPVFAFVKGIVRHGGTDIAFPSMNSGRAGKHGAKPRIAERVRSRLSPETSVPHSPKSPTRALRSTANGYVSIRGSAYESSPTKNQKRNPNRPSPNLSRNRFATVEDVVKTFGGWVDDCHAGALQTLTRESAQADKTPCEDSPMEI